MFFPKALNLLGFPINLMLLGFHFINCLKISNFKTNRNKKSVEIPFFQRKCVIQNEFEL